MNRKKLLVVASTLGAIPFLAAYAGETYEFKPCITIPCLKPGFEYSIEALWLRPHASNLNYVIDNKELPTLSPTWTEKEVPTYYKPAFELGVRYIFNCMRGTDVNLTWTHLYADSTTSIAADNATHFLGPDYEIGPAGIPIRNATGEAKFRYDVINLDMGQFIQLGQFLDLRFFGGLSSGFLRENVIANYSGNTPALGAYKTNQSVVSNFTGLGPRFGVHADVNTPSGIGFLAEVAGSALVGTSYAKTTYLSSSAADLASGIVLNAQTIEDKRVYGVVPGFDTKVGVDYKYLFCNNALLTIAAGYQASVYVNAISQYLPNTLVEPLETGGIFVATMTHRLSNYSVEGPFIKFSLAV